MTAGPVTEKEKGYHLAEAESSYLTAADSGDSTAAEAAGMECMHQPYGLRWFILSEMEVISAVFSSCCIVTQV